MQWLQKKKNAYDSISYYVLFSSFFFPSDDHKELLVCIKNFHLCLGRFAFLLNNAEPAFQQLWLDYTLPVLSYFSLFMV